MCELKKNSMENTLFSDLRQRYISIAFPWDFKKNIGMRDLWNMTWIAELWINYCRVIGGNI